MLNAKQTREFSRNQERYPAAPSTLCEAIRYFFTETISAGCKLASDRILTVRISRDRRGEIRGLTNYSKLGLQETTVRSNG